MERGALHTLCLKNVTLFDLLYLRRTSTDYLDNFCVNATEKVSNQMTIYFLTSPY